MAIKVPMRPSNSVIKYLPSESSVYIEPAKPTSNFDIFKRAIPYMKDFSQEVIVKLSKDFFEDRFMKDYDDNPPRVIVINKGGGGNGDGGSFNYPPTFKEDDEPQSPKKPKGKKITKYKKDNKNTSKNNSGGENSNKSYRVDSFDNPDDVLSDSTDAVMYLMNGKFFSRISLTDSFLSSNAQSNGINDTVQNTLFEEFFQMVLTSYQFSMQNVNNYDVSKNASTSILVNYITKLTSHIQIYLYLRSVVEYTDKNPQGNRGMLHLRSKMSAIDLELMSRLKETLEEFYLNPNCVNYLKRMYGTYSTNVAFDSPIIKICPNHLSLDDSNNTNKFRSGSTLRGILKDLTSLIFTSSNIQKFQPGWKINLREFDSNKKYDVNFLMFWHNNNIKYPDINFTDVVSNSRSIADVNEDFYIGSFSNSTEGVIASSIAVYDNSISAHQPGLFHPFGGISNKLVPKNRSSISIYIPSVGKFEGLILPDQAQASFIYSVPYINEVTGQYTLMSNKFQAKQSVGRNMITLSGMVKQAVSYLFL